jgi:asparagine synthase (glutamine-hydrolysing)
MLPTDWFVVLPRDRAAAQRTTERARLLDPYTQVLAYHDGRPWVIGQARVPVTCARRAGATAALIGTHEVTEPQLAEALSAASVSVSGLMRFPGNYHALLAKGGERQICGDVAGLRAVFTARVQAGVLAGSHARVLAQVVDAAPQPDPAHLARLLLSPAPPSALAESGTTPYAGISAVPPGSSVHLSDGRITTTSWWEVPDDETPLADAAPVLREALRVAVGIRLRGRRVVSYEAPVRAAGSALAALVQEHDRSIHLVRTPRMSRDSAVTQPGLRDVVAGARQVILNPSGLEAAPFVLDGPTPFLFSAAQSVYWWGQALSAGVETVLSDGGAHEASSAPLSYLLQASRRNRALARRHVAGWASLGRIARSQVHAHADTGGSYRSWLADCLAAGRRGGWEAGTYAPPWLTPLARDVLADALAQASSMAKPTHRLPHQHGTVASLRSAARVMRAQADAAALFGVRMEYPYADRRVIESALSTRAEERLTPFRNGPLLAAAMSGLPPTAAAPDPDGAAREVFETGADELERLKRLVSGESVLASMGLVDADRLSSGFGSLEHTGKLSGLLLPSTLMCELWARSLYPGAAGRENGLLFGGRQHFRG